MKQPAKSTKSTQQSIKSTKPNRQTTSIQLFIRHALSSLQKVLQQLKAIMSIPVVKIVSHIILAILGALGSIQLLRFLNPNSVSLTNNFLNFAVIFVLYLYYRQPAKLEHRAKTFAITFSIFLAAILILGGQLEFYSNIFWNWRTIAKIFCVTILIYPILSLLTYHLEKLTRQNFTIHPRKHTLIAFACILAVTLVIWLIIFPGIYTYDMASQNEIITKGGATGDWYIGKWSVAHWSLSYGFLLAGLLDLGKLIFGNFEAGLAIAIFIQAIFVAYVESRITVFAAKLSRSYKIYVISILFFCLMPFLVVTSLSAAQDVLFASLFALVVINLTEFVLEKNYFEHKLDYLKIPILSFLMCTVRSNGVYCLIFLFIFVLLFYRQPKRKLLFLITVPILAAFIYNGPFMKLINIQKNTSLQEILSVPSQQLARVYYFAPNTLTNIEREKIEHYYDIDDGTFELYQSYPLIADYTKESLNTKEISNNVLDYIGLWLNVGLKNPDDYVEAFLLNSFGFWYPNKNYNDPRINLELINYPGFTMTGLFVDRVNHPLMKPIERQSINNDLAAVLDDFIFDNKWLNVPFYSTLCAIGTYMLLLIFTIGYIFMKRQYQLLMPLSLVFGLYLTLLLSPVAIFRYGYPIVILAPILIALIFVANHRASSRHALPRQTLSRHSHTSSNQSRRTPRQ